MSNVYAGAQLNARSGTGFWSAVFLERFHRVFAIVIVLQLIQCFKDYWWPETYSIIYTVLVFTAVCELAFTRWHGLRLTLESAAAVAVSAVYSPYYSWTGWPDNWKSGAEWKLFYEFHIASLHPFAVLAIGTVLAVHALSWFGRSRGAVISLLIASIGVLAAFDSFFPFELWRNIAWVVSAGLGWLVVLHLRLLRARHPESWEALAERPVALALPALLVIALLIVAGIMMPRAPALLEDPYTLWSEARGIQVSSLAGEGGVFGGSPGLSGSGSASSGYGRDDRNIGGGFDFDYSPVMTVQTSRRSYWRGETKAEYTGKGWSDLRTQLIAVQAGPDTNFKMPGRAEGVKTEKIDQKVTILRKDRIPVLFGAGPVTKLTELDSDNNQGLLLNTEEGELRWRRPARVKSYTLESDVTVLDREALKQVPHAAPGSVSIDLAPYLQLPESLPVRVAQLAEKVTAAGKSDFEKADLLEKYLKKTYPYNNKPDTSKQQSADVTDAFLFEIKMGYCDYYSTAFVVMARTLGIPARWVKGYASGIDAAKLESMRFAGPNIDPDGAGIFTVRNADAHSWGEVYFEGYGWIPFEPTSGFSVPQPAPVNADPAVTQDPAVSQPADPAGADQGSAGWWLPVSGGLALFAAAAVVLLRKRRGVRLWRRIRYAGSSPDERIIREMERLLKFMKRRGMKRDDHETMRETIHRWGDKFASLKPDFEGILLRFEHARYASHSGGESEARDFEAAVARLRKAL